MKGYVFYTPGYVCPTDKPQPARCTNCKAQWTEKVKGWIDINLYDACSKCVDSYINNVAKKGLG